MRRWSRYLVGAAAVAGLLVLAAPAGAETGTLEMKRVDVPADAQPSDTVRLALSTSSQYFFQQLGGPEGMVVGPSGEAKPKFSDVVKKEPKYVAETPFRGVAALGSQHYGFALDAALPEKAKEEPAKESGQEKTKAEEKGAEKKEAVEKKEEGGVLSVLSKAFAPSAPKAELKADVVSFARLYFDLNHNGDLTDDEVIEATSSRAYSGTRSQSVFPTVGLTIEADGKKMDYAFRFRVYSNRSSNLAYANAMLNSAAYREGEITLEGKKRRIVLIDFNSNGRFDDVGGVNDEIELSDGTVYPKMGDRLYIDPQMQSGYGNPYDPTSSKDQFQVGKLIRLDDRLYDLKIDPSGETLTLEPSSASLGYVTNPNKGFRAMIYGDQGVLEIDDNGSGRASVPEGRWKLMSYTIEKPEEAKPEEAKPEAGEKKKEESILDVLSSVLSISGGRQAARRSSMVSARAKRDFEAVTVVGGKDVEMRFGPPYIAEVAGANLHKGMTTSLEMSLVGIGGEVCTNLIVNGSRPSAPEFTITTKDGEEVAAGKFQYG
ncbi:MAG: hypothetical protein GXX96_11780 [Planctomycetaceae bacterium]|nr:hypothetical protein [Planctomycetaceae bacterium]